MGQAEFAFWRKCDLQVHTPRDANWQGLRPIGIGEDWQGGRATPEDVEHERAKWADAFVEHCTNQGLEAVALTDHHEMVMVPYVQAAIAKRVASDSTFDLWLFPGMELTCHGGVQALVLFDADLSDQWRTQVQQRLGIVTAELDESASRSPARVVQLRFNYADLGAEIDSLGDGIRGRYIVLPNVSQGNHHTVLTDGHHADFRRMPYVGGYVDNGQNIGTLGGKNLRRLSGKDALWGTRFIYPLPTSDCRSADYKTLGGNNCWIKLAAPTAEAIRQAFLGHKSRISIERPVTSSLAITRVEVKGSLILTDLSVSLSKELNSLIGGRGSGKSSALEYLAFGLGRSCFDLAKADYAGNDRLSAVVKETLIATGASVELTISQDGAPFTITRSAGSGYQPQVRYPNGALESLATKELRSLFPAVVYSQGELAELGKQAGKRAQLTELLQFVSQDYKKEDDQLTGGIEQAREAVRTAAQRLSGVWREQTELHKLKTGKDSLDQRVMALQKTLPSLSGDDQSVVDRFEKLTSFEGQRAQASMRVHSIMSQLTDLWTSAKPPSDPASDAVEAQAFLTAYGDFDSTFWEGLTSFGKAVGERRDAVDAAAAEWAAVLERALADRDAVMAKLGEHRTVTSQISSLQRDSEAATLQIAELTSKMRDADEQARVMAQAVARLKEAVRVRVERTTAWAQQIEELSAGRIKAAVNTEGDVSEIREAVDALAARTGSQEANRLRQIDDLIAGSSAWSFLDEIRSECQNALHHKLVGSSKAGDKPSCARLNQVLGGSEKTHSACFELMDLTRFEAIATAIPKPDISLSYCDLDRVISFEKASEGQRAAALLFMLLQQTGGPLIVDQPEGDLDNSVIAELTDILHEAKKKRQIVFVSHNANVVVNGSSELVVHLEVGPDGMRKPACIGAIDSAVVCRTITSTMEGGEKAFRDRQVKYGY